MFTEAEVKKNLFLFFCGFLIASLIGLIFFYFWSTQKMVKVHTLTTPLLLSSRIEQNSFSLLPAGTTLYYEKSTPEGFSRYKVYINTEKTLNNLTLTTLTDPTLIDPIWADAVQKEDLTKLMSSYPITKAQLQQILKSPSLTKEDVESVLNEYLDKHTK